MPTGLTWIQWVLAFGLASSAVYYLAVLLSAARFFRPVVASPPGTEPPPVSVLKPIRGADETLADNLATLCRQDYPCFQIVCGVAEADDPAVEVVQRLQRQYPQVDLTLVVDPRTHGSNHKVGNLRNMYDRAKHDVIVVADSDIRVPADHLRRMVASLRQPRVGIVTCLYRAVAERGGVPTKIEALSINTDFVPMVLVARLKERFRYAFGATIALRRETLDRVGGFAPLGDYLADDYQLGHRVAATGEEVVLADHLVENVIALSGWRHLFRHQLRWARTSRNCRPLGYFCSVFTHGSLWALLTLLSNGGSRAGLLAAGTVIALRGLVAAMLVRRWLRTEFSPLTLPLVFLRDLFGSAVWMLAFLGNSVWWSERRLRILADGRMVETTAAGERAGAAPWRQQSLRVLRGPDPRL